VTCQHELSPSSVGTCVHYLFSLKQIQTFSGANAVGQSDCRIIRVSENALEQKCFLWAYVSAMSNRTFDPQWTLNLLAQIDIWVRNYLLLLFSQKATWIVVAGIILGLFIYTRVRWYLNEKKGHLTYQLKKELQKSCKQEKFVSIMYLPSWESAVLIFVISAAVFWVSHTEIFTVFPNSLKYGEDNHYQNLIAIHAGIGAIIFALLIFVAESLREDETKDRARVLVKESFLFPLTVGEIAGFFIFIWGNVNFLAILAPLVMAILTIISLSRLLLVLLSKARFAKKRVQLLKDRIKRSIDLAITERYGNSILLQKLGQGGIELQYNPFSLDSDEKIDRYSFYSDKAGVITNIRLNKLNEFAKILEGEANKNGFSFYKDKAKPDQSSPSRDAPLLEAVAGKFEHADRQFLHKKFRDRTEQADDILISVEKKIIKDPNVLTGLTKLAKEGFVIKKQDNFSEEIKLEIDGLKDQFIQAIDEKKLGKIDEAIKTYINISETFLEALNACGGGYTYEQAQKERTTIFSGWNEIRWLSESIREIYIKAIQSHDPRIIQKVAHLPLAIAIRAINTGDQYVYQEFVSFPGILYRSGLKEEKKDTQDLMFELSWLYLKEMSDYYIEYQLKRKANDVNLIKKYRDFAIPVFATFQDLIKTAFEERDYTSFSTFLAKLSSLYRDFAPKNEYPNSESLFQSLARIEDEKAKEDIHRKIEIQNEKESAAKDIQLKKDQVIFGLSAWILDKLRNKPADTELLKFYNDISARLPKTLPYLTEAYISSREFQTEDLWNWVHWEIVPDTGVQSIEFHSKLDAVYCVQALQILEHTPQDSANSIALPHSRDLAFLAENRPDSHSLIRLLDSIATHPSEWNFVLSKEAIQKVPALKMLLVAAKVAQEKSEEEYLKSAKIDPTRLEEFKEKIKAAFYESVYLRPLLKRSGSYKDRSSEQLVPEIRSWGYNRIDDKGAFIKNWHVYYMGWGEIFGTGLANSEDETIFERMIKGASRRSDVTKENLITEIEKATAGSNLKDPIIVQTLDPRYDFENLRRSEAFIAKFRRDCPKTPFDNHKGYTGILEVTGRQIPVFDIFIRNDEQKNKVLICEISNFGVVTQYSPIERAEDYNYRYDIFLIRVTDLNENDSQRQKIIDANPPWLQEHSDKEGYLRQKVLINVFQKFDFKIEKTEAAHVINVTDLPPIIRNSE
jgi:hypothetical protein